MSVLAGTFVRRIYKAGGEKKNKEWVFYAVSQIMPHKIKLNENNHLLQSER